MTESEYLSELYQGIEAEEETDFLHINQLLSQYDKAKDAKVGEIIACACCGSKMVKKSYQQKFCSLKCKDKYWNTVDEKRRVRASNFS